MIKTIEEASKVLAGQWLPAPELMPQGWPENIEAVTDEFRLGIIRPLSVGQFKTDLLRLVSDGKITARSATGSYLSPQSEPAESTLVDVFEAQAALEAEGMKFQYAESAASSGTPESAEPSAPPFALHSRATIHRAETRKNTLSSVIAKAKEIATNPDDAHSHWAAFVRLAEENSPPSPLIGFVEDEGVKYQGEREVKFITKNNFMRRVRRASTTRGH